MEILLEMKADVNAVNSHRATAAHAAAGICPASLRILLDAKAAVDARDGNTQAPLHIASRMGGMEAMQLLLEAGSKAIQARDKWQRNPLLWSVLHMHPDMTHALLERKAEPDLFVKASYQP